MDRTDETDPEFDSFARRMGAVFGEDGRRWMGELPDRLAAAAARWDLALGEPVARLSFNYVTAATTAAGERIILKLGVPRDELRCEIDALRLYDGRSAVRLLDADAAEGALLLERLEPGARLKTLFPERDEEATAIAAGLMRRIWHAPPPGHSFPHVSSWIAGLADLRPHYGGTTGPFPARLVDQAERLFAELLADPHPPVVLHGDMNHENMLSAEREPWLVIDPKGVIGEPEYEVGALIRNPQPIYQDFRDMGRLQSRRLDMLAEQLGFDRQRLWAWSFAQLILSMWWNVEDGAPFTGQRDLAVAEVLSGLG
ncbi:MAG TPA: aminoglycoside phosphotransferase family protein [Herpetosiphonaceae bacterium]